MNFFSQRWIRIVCWFVGVLLVLIALLAVLYVWMNARTFQLFGDLIPHVSTTEKVVALTFDDGPSEHTSDILGMLAQTHTSATFFLIGQSVNDQPVLARAIVDAGHQVGNHSYNHDRMVFKTPAFIRNELLETNNELRAIGFTDQIVFRPPYGKKLVLLPWYLNKLGLKSIMWNVDPGSEDGLPKTSEAYAQFMLERTHPGSIILLHPMYNDADRQAIPEVIQQLKKRGYRFVTVNELLKLR